jgi:PST family polysaccharide transporter
MALVVWPLAIGLGTIAPTLVAACFDERWHGIAPFLTILSFMTAVKPITWVPVAYLQAVQRPRLIMWLSFSRAALVLPLVVAFGSVGGPLWACVGACLGYTIHSVGSVVVTGRTTGLPITSYLVASFRPLVACVPMAAAVTLTTVLLARFEAPLLASLGAQILVGGLVYVGTALLLVRSTTLELMRVALGVIRERSASPTDLPSTALHT